MLIKVHKFFPSRHTISRNIHTVAVQTHASFREVLLEPLKSEAVPLSLDLWTDRLKQIFCLGITATSIDPLHKYQTIALCCTEFTENKKNENNIEKINTINFLCYIIKISSMVIFFEIDLKELLIGVWNNKSS